MLVLMIIKGEGLKINGLDLDGTLVVDLEDSASLTIEHAKVQNKGWRIQPNKEGPGESQESEAIVAIVARAAKAHAGQTRKGQQERIVTGPYHTRIEGRRRGIRP